MVRIRRSCVVMLILFFAMAKERLRVIPAVFLLLMKDDRILLMRRFQTGWCDGEYGLPSGHLEPGETLLQGISREVQEEIGVEVREDALKFAGVMHRKSEEESYLYFVFVASDWCGEPMNREPHKCDHVAWFSLSSLPKNTIPEVITIIQNYQRGSSYAEYGWV